MLQRLLGGVVSAISRWVRESGTLTGLIVLFCFMEGVRSWAQSPPSISPFQLQHWATTGNGPPAACGTGAAGSLPVYTLLLQPASAGVGDVLYLAMKGPAGACEWVPIVTAP